MLTPAWDLTGSTLGTTSFNFPSPTTTPLLSPPHPSLSPAGTVSPNIPVAAQRPPPHHRRASHPHQRRVSHPHQRRAMHHCNCVLHPHRCLHCRTSHPHHHCAYHRQHRRVLHQRCALHRHYSPQRVLCLTLIHLYPLHRVLAPILGTTRHLHRVLSLPGITYRLHRVRCLTLIHLYTLPWVLTPPLGMTHLLHRVPLVRLPHSVGRLPHSAVHLPHAAVRLSHSAPYPHQRRRPPRRPSRRRLGRGSRTRVPPICSPRTTTRIPAHPRPPPSQPLMYVGGGTRGQCNVLSYILPTKMPTGGLETVESLPHFLHHRKPLRPMEREGSTVTPPHLNTPPLLTPTTSSDATSA